jgi:pimeloyl-ACP methyl ester carboxylesterase
VSQERLWTEVRGAGDPLLVLLHGLNATAAMWEPFDAVVATSWPGRRMLIDLPGHGRSDPLAEYSFGVVAAEVARAIGPPAAPVVIVGHSMGGAVGLTLASGWFGVPVARALAVGVKVEWTAEELEAAARTRERQVKWYGSHQEAEQRFLKVAGIPEDAATDPNLLAGGVRAVDGRFRVAADPRAASIGGPPMESFMAAAAAPVRLACGELDPMVDVDQLRRFDPAAVVIPGCGHNAHVESPSALARLVEIDTLRFVSV